MQGISLLMRNWQKLVIISLSVLLCGTVSAQPEGYDVFVPITKYIVQSNPDALSTWFSDNLEISVLAKSTSASRAQAKQITKTFFETYTPRSFEITHTAGRANMKYVLGNLNAGGENFLVTIFVTNKGESYKIQQFKIERQQ